MKKFKHITRLTAAVTAAVLLYSCGAADRSEEARAPMREAADSTAIAVASDTESGLFADSLSEEQKGMLSKRAIQKLEDYFGCLDIMSDEKYDSTLRSQAKEIAVQMFYDQKKVLDMFSIAGDTPSGRTKTIVSDPVVSSLPQAVNDSTYAGKISFELQTNDRPGRREQVGFTVRKTKKTFGTEQRSVWETYLEMPD